VNIKKSIKLLIEAAESEADSAKNPKIAESIKYMPRLLILFFTVRIEQNYLNLIYKFFSLPDFVGVPFLSKLTLNLLLN
jgi:hypothetical protein